MGLLSEFKSFIANGSVLDLTVGVITGAAFSKVVSSFTDDLVMPSIALLKGAVQQHVPGAAAVAAATADPSAALSHAARLAPAADSGAVAHVAADTAVAATHVATAAGGPATVGEGLAAINLSSFIGALVYFFIISLVIILVVKIANRFRKPAEVAVVNEANLEPVLSREEALLIEIRDALLRGRGPQA